MAEEPLGSAYFDVHAALAEDTLLPAKLVHGAKHVSGVLDSSAGSGDLGPAHMLDMPLWMLQPLLQQHFAEAR